jgi:hypothetical protein
MTRATHVTRLISLVATALASVVLAFAILAFRYPPMPDLAMHEAMIAVMTRLHDPTFVPPGMYGVVAPQANQLFHALAYLLALVVRSDTACKLVVATTLALLPIAMARLLLRAGRSLALAPLTAFVALGWFFRWGLVANLLGLLLFVAFAPCLDSLTRRPTRTNALVAVGAGVLLVLAHESAALSFAIVAVVFALARFRRSARYVVATLAPVVVILALTFGQSIMSARLVGASMQQIGDDYGASPIARFLSLPGALFGGARTSSLAILSAFSCLVIAFAASLCLSRRFRRRERAPRRISPQIWLLRQRHRALAAIFFALYLTFPMSLGGTTLLANRFLPPAFVLLLVGISPRAASVASAPRLRRLLYILLAVVAGLAPALVLTLSWKLLQDGARLARDLDAIIARLPPNVAVAQLDLTPRARSRAAPVPGLASRIQAERGGRMLFAFTDLPPNPLYIRPNARWDEPIVRMAPTPFGFLPAVDGRRFAYLLALETDAGFLPLLNEALAPEYLPVAAEGAWHLYRSTLPLDPIDSPGAALATPPTDSLAARINALHAARALP